MKRKHVIIGSTVVIVAWPWACYALDQIVNPWLSASDDEGRGRNQGRHRSLRPSGRAEAHDVAPLPQRLRHGGSRAGHGGREPAAGAQLAAPAAGVVAKVNVVEGQQVEQGDVLVELNSGTATANYARQEARTPEKIISPRTTRL